MFGMNEKTKGLRENLLEKLIDHLMMTPDGKPEGDEKSENPLEEALESPDEEASEDAEGKPKLDLSIMKVEAKPKKFSMPDGSEQEDESIADLLKRKGIK